MLIDSKDSATLFDIFARSQGFEYTYFNNEDHAVAINFVLEASSKVPEKFFTKHEFEDFKNQSYLEEAKEE